MPYWLEPPLLEKAFNTNPLPDRTDVLVIGGGYTGTTAAIRLKQAGVQVTLIDKEKLGTTASARNGGMTLTGLSEGLATVEKKLGKQSNTAFADPAFRAIPFYRGNPWFQPFVYAYFSLMDRWA